MTFFLISSAFAADDALPDAAQESRAQNLFREIRCVVCQAETIADSPASAAVDMRRDVREHIASGDGDDAIKTYLASRYGDFVLMRPPLKPATALLWFGPLLILLAAIGMAWKYFKPRKI